MDDYAGETINITGARINYPKLFAKWILLLFLSIFFLLQLRRTLFKN